MSVILPAGEDISTYWYGPEMNRKQIVSVVIALAAVALVLSSETVRAWLFDALHWMEQHPTAAVPLLSIGLLLAIVLLAPTWVFMVAAGYLYGTLKAVLLIWPVYVLGATLTFFIARHVAREQVEQRMASRPRFASLDRAAGKSGFSVVLLTRVALVIPYNLLNYAFGVTSVGFSQYFWGTAIGSTVMVGLNAYVGASATSLAALGPAGGGLSADWRITALQFGLVSVTIALLVLFVARALRQQLEE